MPGFDGTGPRRMGPMTGGGRGYCAVPLKAISVREADELRSQGQALRGQLTQIESRIEELEKAENKSGGESKS